MVVGSTEFANGLQGACDLQKLLVDQVAATAWIIRYLACRRNRAARVAIHRCKGIG